jgi:hypothetical protein
MMSKVFHLPTLLLSISFISALLAVGHGPMMFSSNWLVLLLPIALGSIYSFLLNRMARNDSARSVFRSSLLTALGLVLTFLWLISFYYFPELYYYHGSGNTDFGFILSDLIVTFAIPVITLYSIFALWLPTKLAIRESSGEQVIAIIHGGFWGLLLVAFCIPISSPTFGMFSGSYGQILLNVRNLAFIELGICIATLIASMGSWFLVTKNRLP